MKITQVKTTPLRITYSLSLPWGRATEACVVLVEVHTSDGIIGYGESIATSMPSAVAIEAYLRQAEQICLGREPFSNARLVAEAHHALFRAGGIGSLSRLSAQVLSGLELALWDVMGKAVGQPAHALLGGAVRDEIRYFGWPVGNSPAEVVADARRLAERGFDVIYLKAGFDDLLDLEIVSAVREAIGPENRLRVDVNEQWTPERASRMIRKLLPFDVEVVEQPSHSESVPSLARIRAHSPIGIAVDQSVATPFHAYEVCRQHAADLIVVGLHEAGGLARLAKVAHVAEAAGVNICIHGLLETGITTCASNQIAATISNLDDGNQHMNRFLDWDIVKTPELEPVNGRLPVLTRPGLGFEIDWEGVERAKEAFASAARDTGLR